MKETKRDFKKKGSQSLSRKVPSQSETCKIENQIFGNVYDSVKNVKRPLNFEIEVSRTNESDFFYSFEKYFTPERILKQGSGNWKFKAMNLKKKIVSLKSLVLVIRSQYNQYRKSYEDFGPILVQKEHSDNNSFIRHNLLRKLGNKKVQISFSDMTRPDDEKNCFMKLKKDVLYIYQKLLCFKDYLQIIPLQKVYKIFYLKQHLVLNCNFSKSKKKHKSTRRKIFKIRFNDSSKMKEFSKFFKIILT